RLALHFFSGRVHGCWLLVVYLVGQLGELGLDERRKYVMLRAYLRRQLLDESLARDAAVGVDAVPVLDVAANGHDQSLRFPAPWPHLQLERIAFRERNLCGSSRRFSGFLIEFAIPPFRWPGVRDRLEDLFTPIRTAQNVADVLAIAFLEFSGQQSDPDGF